MTTSDVREKGMMLGQHHLMGLSGISVFCSLRWWRVRDGPEEGEAEATGAEAGGFNGAVDTRRIPQGAESTWLVDLAAVLVSSFPPWLDR